MKAMILAAGRGERMRPLTDATPKPLLKVAGKTLLEHNIENLRNAGFERIVINIAHLGRQIMDYCGGGERWGVTVEYSDEGETALETAGGIAKALPLLGTEPFLVVNADIICAYPLALLRGQTIDLAHLVLTANPPHHPEGDFGVAADGRLSLHVSPKFTYSGVGVFQPRLFYNLPSGPLKLRPVLNRAIQAGRISGEVYTGLWMDIGTPQRLSEVDGLLREGQIRR